MIAKIPVWKRPDTGVLPAKIPAWLRGSLDSEGELTGEDTSELRRKSWPLKNRSLQCVPGKPTFGCIGAPFLRFLSALAKGRTCPLINGWRFRYHPFGQWPRSVRKRGRATFSFPRRHSAVTARRGGVVTGVGIVLLWSFKKRPLVVARGSEGARL